MQQRNGTEPLLQDNSITVNSPISITIEMKRRFVRNLFSRASSTRISHPSNRKWDRLVVRDRPDPSRWTKGQAETRGRGRETSGMRVNGNLDGDVSTTERRQKRRANEISAFLKKKKKTIAASQNHCSGAISRPARSGLDRVKKQFSFRRDRTAGDHGYSIAYLGFDKAIPIQSSFERTDDRARGKRAARLGRRSTGSAPERAKNWTRCERFQAERTSVDPISKRRVKEIATVSLAQLCWFRAHYCALLYSWAEMGKISISLTGKLVIWDQF